MSGPAEDQRWIAAALTLAERSRARTGTNPNVGCIIVKDGRAIGRGWTQLDGRPHAEAMALNQAASVAAGATVYVTLEPCAHQSERGPACSETLAASGVARVVVGIEDPDPRTSGKGIERLKSAGIEVIDGVMAAEARRSMAGWLSRTERGRPFVTLKLATSLDGCIARANGESKWITGEAARAHTHLERARHEAILVGRGTFDADNPRLDVRLDGLGARSPRRILLTHGEAPEGWTALANPEAIKDLNVQYVMVEGGATAASSFLKACLVDRILLYRAPIMIGGGKACLADIGLDQLSNAHGHWRRTDTRALGKDVLEVYERTQEG